MACADSSVDKLSKQFAAMKRFASNNVNWKKFTDFENVPVEVIREFKKEVMWGYVSSTYSPLTFDFIYEFQNYIQWDVVFFNDSMNENLINELVEYHISKYKDFDEDYSDIEDDDEDDDEYQGDKNAFKYQFWRSLCERELSEDFMREYANYVDWFTISCTQTLSESFIEEFIDKVDWDNIKEHQTLSDAFIEKHDSKFE